MFVIWTGYTQYQVHHLSIPTPLQIITHCKKWSSKAIIANVRCVSLLISNINDAGKWFQKWESYCQTKILQIHENPSKSMDYKKIPCSGSACISNCNLSDIALLSLQSENKHYLKMISTIRWLLSEDELCCRIKSGMEENLHQKIPFNQ